MSKLFEKNGLKRSLSPRVSKLPFALRPILAAASSVIAQNVVALAQTPPSSLSEEEKLEQDFTDPFTTLPQLVVRDTYTPANCGPCAPLARPRNAETDQVLIRLLIPRIPSNTLLPLMQLVRPTFPLVTVPSSRGGTRTKFGDPPLFDIAALPWPDRKKTGLLVGYRIDRRVSNRHLENCRPGRVADGFDRSSARLVAHWGTGGSTAKATSAHW